MSRRARSDPSVLDGVLLVDKAGSSEGAAGRRGPTSHDVVACARRALGTRAVGHAGTLDPMASGLLVLLVGRATRLARFASAADKTYEAELRLGIGTDTLDAEGRVVASHPVPPCSEEAVRIILPRFTGCFEQRVPEVSAVRVGGRRLYARARAGERFEAPVRQVVVHELLLLSVASDRIRFRVRCGKGFYVRALGRDLAEALGTVGHLTALRRTESGSFRVEEAIGFGVLEAAARGEGAAREALREAMWPLPRAAARMMPSVALDAQQAEDVRHGRPTRCPEDCPPPEGVPLALLRASRLLAVGERRGGRLRVLRGFGA